MYCNLCLKYDVNSFNLVDDEGVQRNAQFILQIYFYFCFTDDRKGGHICRKCWMCVETFNDFYLHVEYVHARLSSMEHNKNSDAMDEDSSIGGSTPVIIKLETVNDEAFPPTSRNSDSNSDNSEISIKLENEAISNGDNPKTLGTEPKKGRPKKRKEKLQCKKCNDSFSTAAKLRRHDKEIHDIIPFKCREKPCRAGFQTSKALAIHISKKHGTAPCPQCKKELRKDYISTHIKRNHSTESQVICDLCGKVSNCKRHHILHIQSTHSDNPSMQCDICSKWFKNKIGIQFHMINFHIKNKPVKCEICGWVSPNRRAFYMHRKVKHVEGFSTRLKCLVCGHGFGDRTKLREHSSIHSGVTDANKCTFCDKAFRFNSSLSLHKKKCPAKNM